MNYWTCPRCGARLLWQRFAIVCPAKRCGYRERNPVPTTSEGPNGPVL